MSFYKTYDAIMHGVPLSLGTIINQMRALQHVSTFMHPLEIVLCRLSITYEELAVTLGPFASADDEEDDIFMAESDILAVLREELGISAMKEWYVVHLN